jgi:ketosteroid isomerase-like protein
MTDADKAVLKQILAEELSYGHSSGKVEGKNSFIESLTSGKSDFVSINLSEQQIIVVENTALVRHKLQAETNDSGKAGSVNLYILLVWQKLKGKWKLLARQAVKS